MFVVFPNSLGATETQEGWGQGLGSRYQLERELSGEKGYFLRSAASLRNLGNFLPGACLSPFCLPLEISRQTRPTTFAKEADLIPLFPFCNSDTRRVCTIPHNRWKSLVTKRLRNVSSNVYSRALATLDHWVSQQGPSRESGLGALHME